MWSKAIILFEENTIRHPTHRQKTGHNFRKEYSIRAAASDMCSVREI